MTKKSSSTSKTLKVIEGTNIQAVQPWLAAEAEVQGFVKTLLAHKAVTAHLGKARYRVLSSEPVESFNKEKASAKPRHWLTTIYDYTNNQALLVKGRYPAASEVSVTPTKQQPLPSAEEWQDAVSVVSADKQLGALLADKQLTAYRPMPPLALEEGEHGEIERTLHVGLLPAPGSQAKHQIVAVNMVKRSLQTYEHSCPATSLAAATTCGAPDPFVFNAPLRGTAGQLTIAWPAANPIWRMTAVRPSASSGTRGSGIDLRNVEFKGKRVLTQAHVPILNVLYDNNACGPYRDWQWDEQSFECTGIDVAPGFRWGHSRPNTICDTGSDKGNFNGVALFDAGHELVLMTEMAAGWYRYIMEWHFGTDGTLKPVFKFGATANSCVCNVHHHHCYWRLDFDLKTANNNLVEEFSLPNTWTPLNFEIKRNRIANRKWRVRNTSSGEICEIIPGPDDGTADAYGRGDLWVVKYRPAELDDGYNNTTGPGTAADINKFIAPAEPVANQDLVVWYGAHFRHALTAGDHHCHAVGPTLKLANW